MRTRLFLPAILSILASPAAAWGPTGHRVTGAIADANLSGVARAKVRMLLGEEDLAEASTWPDDMRSDPSEFWQKTASPWHYVTVMDDAYSSSDAPAQGDAVTALTKFRATLLDPKATDDQKRAALRFIVHIVGDLHQPLHAGAGTDRGGNDVKVEFFGKPTNLHSVWDSAIIESHSLSYTEYAAWLSRSIRPEEVVSWSASTSADWVRESVALRRTVYPAEPKLGYSYAYQHRPNIDARLKMAGVRIAAYLNAALEARR
ncbi:MAG: S1/P1 nuclease [Sphingobium limneticum]